MVMRKMGTLCSPLLHYPLEAFFDLRYNTLKVTMIERYGRRLLSAAAVDRLLRSQSAVASCVADLPDLAEEDVWASAHGAIGGGSGGGHTASTATATWVASLRSGGGHGAGGGLATSGAGRGGRAVARHDGFRSCRAGVEEDGEPQPDKQWVPPHEYLARENVPALATSVFEGVGRTLKGRDMSGFAMREM
ncbi:hypothetical protein HPP92_001551 [Vanilla planifolia]|uniref:Uncharacterized protein n=1 Tax=Vanilla planifolia TaxID=51239 RepID=A0A835S4S6_VANPL|nr:hypothetical protein HPP92_001551 [Vanilla planifolia]